MSKRQPDIPAKQLRWIAAAVVLSIHEARPGEVTWAMLRPRMDTFSIPLRQRKQLNSYAHQAWQDVRAGNVPFAGLSANWLEKPSGSLAVQLLALQEAALV